jgi:hypothetical protein
MMSSLCSSIRAFTLCPMNCGSSFGVVVSRMCALIGMVSRSLREAGTISAHPCRKVVPSIRPAGAPEALHSRPKECSYSDHAADLGVAPSARHGQAPLAYDLTGSTSGQRRGSPSKT